ncbi:hypothetical protein SETIT_9G089200v2 [Setaria italica]|uniref:Potassium channel domain-containing protein n=1 Tax=Setaria italica TaxID=4555 RepID=A0A368SEK7_SETIT|nr:hypothetical protein SETIT_9G089200v2 [Setaria italica]
MADNSIHQAFIEDPPNVLKEKPSEGAKWSTPAYPTDQKPSEHVSAERISAFQAKDLFKGYMAKLQACRPPRLCLPGYLLVGVIIFYCFMDQISGKRTNRVLDALYFVIVTMTAVGYGDFVPKRMATIALFISKAADYLVEKQEVLFFKAMHMNMKGGEAKMLRAMETYRIKYKFYTVTLLLVMIIVTGNLFLWKVEKLSLVDSFYCVCATMTTLGYVDKCFSSKLGPIFAIFWLSSQKMLAKWVLIRRITTMDLEAADLDGDHQVGAAEFVLYKLKELGKISQEEISSFLEVFDKLDVDGTISTYDLTLAQTSQ